MPLELEHVDPLTGTVCNYWRIIDINVRWQAWRADVVLGLYVDQAAAFDGKQPLSTTTLTLDNFELDALSPIMGPAIYGIIAQRAEFAGAIGVE